MHTRGTRLLSRADVMALLSLPECTAAVEQGFRTHAQGGGLATGVLGIEAEGGGFHIKAAGTRGEGATFATKINGNFAHNERRGLPRIQGLIVLSDVATGYPLAVMDSIEITVLRTAAATAVAVRHLARANARVVTIAGCGRQAAAQLTGVAGVRQLERVYAFDADSARAAAFARRMSAALAIPVQPAAALRHATLESDIVITCTSAERAILGREDVRPGTFIAAVGADASHKQEIDPELLAHSVVVPDLVEQAATIGDLHHAIEAGVMRRGDVRGELGAVLAGLVPGRCDDRETIVFDSTGTAIQDVAAATLVYHRAMLNGRGLLVDLLGDAPAPVFAATREAAGGFRI